MKNVVNPVVVATAFFIGYLCIDLFRHNYKGLPEHALSAVFWILILSVLCKNNLYAFAWLLVSLPFLIILGAILIREYRRQVSASNTLSPRAAPKHHYDPAPYYL